MAARGAQGAGGGGTHLCARDAQDDRHLRPVPRHALAGLQGRERRERALERGSRPDGQADPHLWRPAGGDLLLLDLGRATPRTSSSRSSARSRSRGSSECPIRTTSTRPPPLAAPLLGGLARLGAGGAGALQAAEGAPARRVAARRARAGGRHARLAHGHGPAGARRARARRHLVHGGARAELCGAASLGSALELGRRRRSRSRSPGTSGPPLAGAGSPCSARQHPVGGQCGASGRTGTGATARGSARPACSGSRAARSPARPCACGEGAERQPRFRALRPGGWADRGEHPLGQRRARRAREQPRRPAAPARHGRLDDPDHRRLLKQRLAPRVRVAATLASAPASRSRRCSTGRRRRAPGGRPARRGRDVPRRQRRLPDGRRGVLQQRCLDIRVRAARGR